MRLTQLIRSLERLLFAGIVIFSPFRYPTILLEHQIQPIYKEYTNVLFFISDGFLIATLVLWLIDTGITRRHIHFSPSFLTVSIAALTLLSLLSVATSFDPLVSLYNFIRIVFLFGLYLFVSNEIVDLNQMIFPVSALIFLQSFVSIPQVLMQRSIGLQVLGELILDPAKSGISVVFNDSSRFLRAYGLTDHPNILGGCLAFSLLILLCWFGIRSNRWHWLVVGIFIIGIISLFYTFSRSAWLAFALSTLAGGVILLATNQRVVTRRWLGLFGMTILVLSPFLYTHAKFIGTRLNWLNSFDAIPQETQAIGERVLLNQAANKLFSNHALTGVGLSAFPYALMLSYPDFPVDYQPAHLVLLDVATEVGAFGGIAFALAIILPWIALWLNRIRFTWSAELIGATVLLLAVIIVGFFDYYPWMLNPGRLWMWLAWGLWAGMYRRALLKKYYA